MHDIDHGRLEAEAEFEQYEQLEAFEFENSEQHETESLFCENGEMCEAQETELALELLEVSSEAELETFLCNLARRAVQTGRGILSSPDMRAVGGILKGAAKRALPHLGRAAGRYFGGPQGARLGGRIAGAAGQLFGLELEGLSGEDKEFETARGFVRFAGNAVRNMSGMANSQNPLAAAQNAAIAAARIYAPGFLATAGRLGRTAAGPSLPPSFGHSGRWLRRGRKIVLYGV
ncbi:hypothetical protein [Candidatus Electronema sp. TJ]|uniref:hypothetical protein n=1 Tax=Candidatus Electronema sp. TJ TaxID=3401573 RepID=UPI003AA8CB03